MPAPVFGGGVAGLARGRAMGYFSWAISPALPDVLSRKLLTRPGQVATRLTVVRSGGQGALVIGRLFAVWGSARRPGTGIPRGHAVAGSDTHS